MHSPNNMSLHVEIKPGSVSPLNIEVPEREDSITGCTIDEAPGVETNDDPLLRQALSALDDCFFRTGEPANQAVLTRIADKHGLDAVRLVLLTRRGRGLGLVDTAPSRDPRDADIVEVAEGVDIRVTSSDSDSLRELFRAARRYPLLTARQEKRSPVASTRANRHASDWPIRPA